MLNKFLSLLGELHRLPMVEIVMWGGEAEHEVFASFTSRHRRFPLIQRKQWGVALLRVPECFDVYLKGKARQALRSNRRRAAALGYTFGRINPLVDSSRSVWSTRRSAPVRDAQSIPPILMRPS